MRKERAEKIGKFIKLGSIFFAPSRTFRISSLEKVISSYVRNKYGGRKKKKRTPVLNFWNTFSSSPPFVRTPGAMAGFQRPSRFWLAEMLRGNCEDERVGGAALSSQGVGGVSVLQTGPFSAAWII